MRGKILCKAFGPPVEVAMATISTRGRGPVLFAPGGRSPEITVDKLGGGDEALVTAPPRARTFGTSSPRTSSIASTRLEVFVGFVT